MDIDGGECVKISGELPPRRGLTGSLRPELEAARGAIVRGLDRAEAGCAPALQLARVKPGRVMSQSATAYGSSTMALWPRPAKTCGVAGGAREGVRCGRGGQVGVVVWGYERVVLAERHRDGALGGGEQAGHVGRAPPRRWPGLGATHQPGAGPGGSMRIGSPSSVKAQLGVGAHHAGFDGHFDALVVGSEYAVQACELHEPLHGAVPAVELPRRACSQALDASQLVRGPAQLHPRPSQQPAAAARTSPDANARPTMPPIE